MHLVTCTLCLVLYILACSVFIVQFSLLNLVTALRVDYPGGYLHRAPCMLHHAPCTVHRAPCMLQRAPCTVHLATLQRAPCNAHCAPCNAHCAPCTVHRAPTGLSPITDNQGVSHGKYEPLLLSSNVLSSPPLMLDLLLKYQFVPIAPYKY